MFSIDRKLESMNTSKFNHFAHHSFYASKIMKTLFCLKLVIDFSPLSNIMISCHRFSSVSVLSRSIQNAAFTVLHSVNRLRMNVDFIPNLCWLIMQAISVFFLCWTILLRCQETERNVGFWKIVHYLLGIFLNALLSVLVLCKLDLELLLLFFTLYICLLRIHSAHS